MPKLEYVGYMFATKNTFALLFYDPVVVSKTPRKVQVN